MDKLIEQLKVLSNPQRLIILKYLIKRDYYISELSKEIKMSQPLTQIYLKQLEIAGIVRSKLVIDKTKQVFKRVYTVNNINIIINKKTIEKLNIKEV